MKKVICAALSLSLLSSISVLALAPEELVLADPIRLEAMDTVAGDGKTIVNGQPVQIGSGLLSTATVLVSGTASVAEGATSRVTLMGTDEEGNEVAELVLNLSESTLILDGATGDTATFADIRTGDTIYAYVAPAMALSYPAQASATLILVNLAEDQAVPLYAEVDAVQTDAAAGTVTLVTNMDASLILTDETAITPYLTRQLLTKDTIRPGMKVLAWYEEGSAGQSLTPTKLIAFNSAYAGIVAVADNGDISIDGEVISMDLAKPYVDSENAGYMVPMRSVAQALGCTVTWDQATGRVTVSKDGQTIYAYVIGEEATDAGYYIDYVLDSARGITYFNINNLISLHNLKFVG